MVASIDHRVGWSAHVWSTRESTSPPPLGSMLTLSCRQIIVSVATFTFHTKGERDPHSQHRGNADADIRFQSSTATLPPRRLSRRSPSSTFSAVLWKASLTVSSAVVSVVARKLTCRPDQSSSTSCKPTSRSSASTSSSPKKRRPSTRSCVSLARLRSLPSDSSMVASLGRTSKQPRTTPRSSASRT